ncbi:MAG TPA: carbamoyltransferase C-terminal domain-containing protein [Anaeromyxobacteraceae bacterium]|nr:carbamoyltransferase C-terminal domain-containing protein [Anaeromyxobacteraceae bacterium]
MAILGLNAYHGDAAAALVRDGRLAAAIEEERLNRTKHCAGFPALAARAVLDLSGTAPGEVEHVAVSRDPRAHLGRKVLAALRRPGLARQVRARIANLGRVRGAGSDLARALGAGPSFRPRRHAVGHHRAHLASAFYVSPFEEAACLSLDGFGDFVSAMRAVGRDRDLEILDEVAYPHSLGLFYTALTQYLGFSRYGEEWKMMGLAPYGTPRYADRLRRLVRPLPGGRFALDTSYFRHATEGIEMTWADGSPHLGRVFSDRLVELLGPSRHPDDPDFLGRWADVAASAQAVYEEIFFHVANDLFERTRLPRLALAGGCALNSVANGKVLERTPFREVFVQPAAGDDGTAVGAAFWVEHAVLRRPRRFVMEHAFTGPAYGDREIGAALDRAGAAGWDGEVEVRRLEDRDLFRETAAAVAAGKVVGWFQGAMEWGPRALGNRSIVADPRRADMKDVLNLRIKHRETFRPFAPSVLEERVGTWFERSEPSPFMLMVYRVREAVRERIPAVTHVDGTGRLQTVSRRTSPRYHALISEFERQTGIGLVLNTSFNEHEPIVATPDDAIACFRKTRMDVLALGNRVLFRR